MVWIFSCNFSQCFPGLCDLSHSLILQNIQNPQDLVFLFWDHFGGGGVQIKSSEIFCCFFLSNNFANEKKIYEKWYSGIPSFSSFQPYLRWKVWFRVEGSLGNAYIQDVYIILWEMWNNLINLLFIFMLFNNTYRKVWWLFVDTVGGGCAWRSQEIIQWIFEGVEDWRAALRFCFVKIRIIEGIAVNVRWYLFFQ